jgi:hypothetical protein
MFKNDTLQKYEVVDYWTKLTPDCRWNDRPIEMSVHLELRTYTKWCAVDSVQVRPCIQCQGLHGYIICQLRQKHHTTCMRISNDLLSKHRWLTSTHFICIYRATLWVGLENPVRDIELHSTRIDTDIVLMICYRIHVHNNTYINDNAGKTWIRDI